MKKIASSALLMPTIFLFFFICLGSCKKDNETIKNNIQSEVTVLETGSNIPIKGATVQAYTCGGDLWYCDRPGDLLGSGITDDSGKIRFNTSSYIAILKITKDKYWDCLSSMLWSPSVTSVALTPIATLRVHYTRINQYPQACILNLQPQTCAIDANTVKQLLQPPSNGIVYLKGAGNCANSIHWGVDTGRSFTLNHFTPEIRINRFDTAEFQIQY